MVTNGQKMQKPAVYAGLFTYGGGHEMGLEAFRSLPNQNKCAYFVPFLPNSSRPFHFVWSFVWSRIRTISPPSAQYNKLFIVTLKVLFTDLPKIPVHVFYIEFFYVIVLLKAKNDCFEWCNSVD